MLNKIITLSSLVLLAACLPSKTLVQVQNYTVNAAENRNIGNVNFAMPLQDFKNAFPDARWSAKNIEGDDYNLAEIKLSLNSKQSTIVYFDQRRIWKIDSRDAAISDANGLGIGSTLKQLQKAWPNGRFFAGIADNGPFARFSNGDALFYNFDTVALNKSCLETSQECALPSGSKVTSLTIHAKAYASGTKAAR